MDNVISPKVYNNFAPNQMGLSVTPYCVTPSIYQSAYDDSQIDFFNTDTDGKGAANAGTILVGGLLLREVLSKWTNKLFSNYFSKHPNVDSQKVKEIAFSMLKDKELIEKPQGFLTNIGQMFKDKGKFNKLNLIIEDSGDKAYFSPVEKAIRVTKDTLISLPHEIGHAVEEHSTNLLKKLQRSRGNYTTLALLLYGLGREKSTNKKGKETWFGKVQNWLYKYNVLIPLVAFAPELITEASASFIGLKYIKNYLKKETNPAEIAKTKAIQKAARKHYAIAFCTYLALPAFAVLDNLIFKKAAQKN